MNNIRVEQVRDKVVGFRPVYIDGGNSTELLLLNGEVVVDRRAWTTVQHALFYSYGLDLSAQRNMLRARLNQKGNLPFYLDEKRVFIPLKTRKVLAPRDGVYGYIDESFISNDIVPAGKNCCEIKLNNGLKVTVLSNRDSIGKSQRVGQDVRDMLQAGRPVAGVHEQVVEYFTGIGQFFGAIARDMQTIRRNLE